MHNMRPAIHNSKAQEGRVHAHLLHLLLQASEDGQTQLHPPRPGAHHDHLEGRGSALSSLRGEHHSSDDFVPAARKPVNGLHGGDVHASSGGVVSLAPGGGAELRGDANVDGDDVIRQGGASRVCELNQLLGCVDATHFGVNETG